jgi:hypothetical protein
MLAAVAVMVGIGIVEKANDVRPTSFVSSTGTVVDVIERHCGEGSTCYDSVISFVAGGVDYSFESAFGNKDMRAGDKVIVWYDPSDQGEVEITRNGPRLVFSTAETDEDRRQSVPPILGLALLVAAAAVVPLWIWWQIRHETHPKRH